METSSPSASPEVPPGHAFHPLDVRRARNRLVLSVAMGILTYGVLGAALAQPRWAMRAVAGWDAAAVLLLILAWAIIRQSDISETRRRAALEDPGRNLVSVIVVGTSALSLFASAFVMRRARELAPGQEAVLIILCLAAVVASWCLTHTAYTLRYAHLYYRDDDGEGEGGLTFPGDKAPDYLDFAYFSFTVGMCFQVSDVTITGKPLRGAVLTHAVLSFAYNTAILALALNLVAGLLG